MEPKFKEGEIIIYQNGDNYELGKVKRVVENPDGTYDYFVWYHMGDTAARTPESTMHKIINGYAFDITRKTVD